MIEKVSVSDTFEMYWYCIVSVHRYIWQKVAVSAHRYILKVSTKGLREGPLKKEARQKKVFLTFAINLNIFRNIFTKDVAGYTATDKGSVTV